MMRLFPLLATVLIYGWCCVQRLSANDKIDFATEIQPILADHCYSCHGPDAQERKGDLRLDELQMASGKSKVIQPHKPNESELLRRILAEGDDRMPPASPGRSGLTAREIAKIRQWILEGAESSKHWAYSVASRPTISQTELLKLLESSPARENSIDLFIREKLAASNLTPSPRADRTTLIRRLYVDLLGLRPNFEEVEEFVGDSRPNAYERLVDRLLASPRYGERLGLHWLDLARYGDSDGFHDDTPRVMHQFRDYVIRSFNEDKPFDQFTIEQLAGDLIPNATLEQQIASAFHRLGPTSSEGGADAKEYAAKYVVDRVNTTATVWLGVTFQCCECHDHKYDPFSTRDFYQLYSFFNQVPEDVLFRGNDAPPVIPTPTEEQQATLAQIETKLQSQQSRLQLLLDSTSSELDLSQLKWEEQLTRGELDLPRASNWHSIGPFFEIAGSTPFDEAYPPENEVRLDAKYSNDTLAWQEKPDLVDGKVHYLRGDKCATYFYRTIHVEQKQPAVLYLGSDDGIKVWVNEKLVHSKILVRVAAPNQDKVPIVLQPGENRILMKVVNLAGGYGFYFSLKEKEKDERLEEVIQIGMLSQEKRSEEQQNKLRRFYRQRYVPECAEVAVDVADLGLQRNLLLSSIPKLRVMADAPQRVPTHILIRGDYRRLGEEVAPQIPESLGKLTVQSPNRLDLARWIVGNENPLTARVIVNQFWQMIFGQGIVRTANDFGVRGEPPSHRELLDWLAIEFTESNWDVKQLLRTIVLSETYRQSSSLTPEQAEKDPQNFLLARGARYRVWAELIRDCTLSTAGILDSRVGGPSVRPYQPGDLWRELSYGDQPEKAYVQSHGQDLYRRGLYTFWKRSVHYPSFSIMDAPNREFCLVTRPRTNTPLQSLVLLNEPTFQEAARILAQDLLRESLSDSERLDKTMQSVLSRTATDREREILLRTLQNLRTLYQSDAAEAERLSLVGEYPVLEDLSVQELAAWSVLTHMLMTLDEAISKE